MAWYLAEMLPLDGAVGCGFRLVRTGVEIEVDEDGVAQLKGGTDITPDEPDPAAAALAEGNSGQRSARMRGGSRRRRERGSCARGVARWCCRGPACARRVAECKKLPRSHPSFHARSRPSAVSMERKVSRLSKELM